MRLTVILLLWSLTLWSEESYTLGHGYKFHDTVTVGAYFSMEYEERKHERLFTVEDVAALAYGDLSPAFSYLVELEATNIYQKEFDAHTETMGTEFHVERAYIDYKYSDALQLRIGKMITPVGYWNSEPINVLRETTSSPAYATQMFPRLLSGLNLYGYLPESSVRYNLFAQKNRDLDDEYINIPNEHFFGAGIEYEANMETAVGGSVGEFVTLADETVRFLQLNAKYDDYPYRVTAEGIIRHNEDSGAQSAYTTAAYVQALYRYTPEHTAVARFEYFDDNSVNDRILILGYGYRPLYPVSFKAEYQWHSISDENRFLTSFSVLF